MPIPGIRIPGVQRLVLGVRQHTNRWILRRSPRRHGPVRIRRNNLFIMPTRLGLVYALLVFVMLLGSMNYSNSLGFVLTFLLVSLGLVTMHHTHRNLLHLQVGAGRPRRVFAGEKAVYEVRIANHGSAPRFGIRLAGTDKGAVDLYESDHGTFLLETRKATRGLIPAPRFKLISDYPLGLFQAWSWIELDMNCLAYPRPLHGSDMPIQHPDNGDGKEGDHSGGEDFSGLRDYQRGDSPRRIHWRAVARNQELVVKQFTSPEDPQRWLDWEEFAGLPTETRLSRLCQAVLDAEREGVRYGLKLPDTLIVPARGDNHRQQCLESLALFRGPSTTETGARA